MAELLFILSFPLKAILLLGLKLRGGGLGMEVVLGLLDFFLF